MVNFYEKECKIYVKLQKSYIILLDFCLFCKMFSEKYTIIFICSAVLKCHPFRMEIG